MRIYCSAALKNGGLAGEDLGAKVKSGCGNAATIVNEAVKSLGGSLFISGEKGGRRLFPGDNLDGSRFSATKMPPYLEILGARNCAASGTVRSKEQVMSETLVARSSGMRGA
jgi:hypothetical protein